jgi:hypothetical protein
VWSLATRPSGPRSFEPGQSLATASKVRACAVRRSLRSALGSIPRARRPRASASRTRAVARLTRGSKSRCSEPPNSTSPHESRCFLGQVQSSYCRPSHLDILLDAPPAGPDSPDDLAADHEPAICFLGKWPLSWLRLSLMSTIRSLSKATNCASSSRVAPIVPIRPLSTFHRSA